MTIIDPRSTLSHPCIRFVFDYRCGSPRYCSVLSRPSYAMIGWPRLFRRRVPEYIERMVYRFNHTQESSSQTIMTVLSTDCAFLACGCSFFGASRCSLAQPGESGGNSSSNFLFPLLLSFLSTLRPTNSSLQVLTLASFPTNPNGSATLLLSASSSILSILVEFRAHRLPRLCPYTALRQTLNATFRMRTTSPALALCNAVRKSSFSCLPAREPCDSAGGSQKLTLNPARVSSPTRRSRISMVL
jgi:hypothetical protein